MTDILVIPDVHCMPGVTTEHLSALGEYIAIEQPDTIVCLGDFADLDSLSSHNTKLSFEGQRFHLDQKATLDGLDALFEPIHSLQRKQRRNKEKQYKPRTVMTLGNHENRINRLIHESPQLEEYISAESLGYERYFEEIVPFKHTVHIAGVVFTHYFSSGAKGYAIGHPNLAGKLAAKSHVSTVVGHDHGFDWSVAHRGDCGRHFACSAGYYGAPDWMPDYIPQTEFARWMAGVLVLRSVSQGWPSGGFEWVTQERLMK